MDEQKPKSSWDDLLKEVGAAPPPDALERKRPAIETTFEPPPEVDVKAAKPKPGDWNALASELGIEVKEAPQRKAPETTHHAGPSSNALEASFTEIEPMESDFEDVVEDEIADIDFGGDEGDDEEEDDFLTAKRKPEPDPNALSGEAARNAFESLFQAGSFAALPPVKKPEPVEPPRQRGGPQWRDLDEARTEEGVEEEIIFEEVTDAESIEGEEAGEEERGRPRRRRRRRRGRGRDGESREAGERSATPGDEEDDEDLSDSDASKEAAEEGEELEGEKPARRRRRRHRRGKGVVGDARADRAAANGKKSAEEDDDDEDDEPLTAAGDDEEEAGDSPRESHKNIPTWSEAISVMVEVNLQSRKNAPSRPTGPRERSRGGRGRGRGGSGRRGKS